MPLTKKDLRTAYIASVAFGIFGGHRFYLEQWTSALSMLIATLLGWYLTGIGWGWIVLASVAVWWISDLVRMRALVAGVNAQSLR